MPLISDILSGADITEHYLDVENEQFKIYRYNKNVYAVRYDENTSQPVDFVHMWHSHKGGPKDPPKYLDQGAFGTVYEKTEDKVFKELEDKMSRGHEKKTNIAILEQKFLLKENNIEEYFILGLWNIKDKNNVFFNMPSVKETSNNFDDNKLELMSDEFILALKKLNELGYMHPDLASIKGTRFHWSPQNMLKTVEGIRLIDLDRGLDNYRENAKFRISGRDQWIYVYNFSQKGDWKKVLQHWYEKNEGKSLSDNPKALLSLYKSGSISLPKSVVYEMHLSNSSENVTEYRSGNKEDRKHTFHEVSAEDFKSQEYKQEYRGIRGDALKRTILKELKDALEDVKTEEELEEIKSNFFKSPEMKIIDKPQGRATRMLGHFGLKTDAHKAAEEIFKKAEEKISKFSNTPL
ncbi:hypothetical protein [Legionella israelensis]|uniref:Dot/Icm T4SS effector n=1 Tax=Legionella israelensis TaxID=454 RepID=A0A0W0WH13_9GAMM|nr:hypothetical protein [Legionella israelensis]KTD31539.1 Dot/Icm T4SS effector [Legionella israelensis]QBS09456.1 hypothetical protein E4T55_06045 [Legionella israelensis]SCX95743.1 DrrA phosphatidylinositol 4-phosphate binding domain-containing protein [Legionella israelensis DSM 19235]STX60362.1 Dot/Icm T4SS effector [Legionella israelensis]